MQDMHEVGMASAWALGLICYRRCPGAGPLAALAVHRWQSALEAEAVFPAQQNTTRRYEWGGHKEFRSTLTHAQTGIISLALREHMNKSLSFGTRAFCTRRKGAETTQDASV